MIDEEQEIRQEIEIFEVLMREMIQVKKVMQSTLARQLRLPAIEKKLKEPEDENESLRKGAGIPSIQCIQEPVEEICTDVVQEPIKKPAKKKKGG